VRDFAPYIAKIKASVPIRSSPATGVPTSRLLVKAANEAGYNGKFFTYYTGVTGTPTALGSTGAGKVYQVAYSHYNMGGQNDAWAKEFKQKYNDDFYTGSISPHPRVDLAGDGPGQVDRPVKVATPWKGMKLKSAFGGEVEMRKSDHQLQQPLYMTVWQKADAKYPYSPRTPA
jgi:branched-chain amino acid transport system substrate-binding protein